MALLLRLLTRGLLDRNGEIEIEYWAQLLDETTSSIEAALEPLVSDGRITRSEVWQCPECTVDNLAANEICRDCRTTRTPNSPLQSRYIRTRSETSRDPAAVFLIHGMNTLGDWQQSFAWRLQLLYGYSVPIFIFKFGHDRLSPFSRIATRRRVSQLAEAIREAQRDLLAAGRSSRCDVIAHSFGTLMFSQLLLSPRHLDLCFGRAILTGAIANESFSWKEMAAQHRVEAVLNHRAGRDIWARLAPWICPGAGSSGRDGFGNGSHVEDLLSPGFAHSDYFVTANFATVIQFRWSAFLNGRTVGGRLADAPTKWWHGLRYLVGRFLVSAALVSAIAIAWSIGPWR